MKLTYTLAAIFCLLNLSCIAQEKKTHTHDNELSIAAGIVPLIAENVITSGFHLHYVKGLGKTKKFGLGISLETILDEHKHYTSSIMFQYRLLKRLAVSYSPGLLIRKEQNNYESQFASHIEVSYEYELSEFHLGPVAELGFEKTGIHYMAGLHIGIVF